MKNKIDSFKNEFEFLNNGFPVKIEMDGEDYPSVEHAFQAAKTIEPGERDAIRAAVFASDAKALGRKLVSLNSNWDNEKLDVMRRLVEYKFNNDLALKLRLLLTGDAELIQGGMRKDQFWGVDSSGIGDNHLGKIIMDVRSEIRVNEGNAESVFSKFLEKNDLLFMSNRIKEVFCLLRSAASPNPDSSCTPELRASVISFMEELE